jgi:hypothetical protein
MDINSTAAAAEKILSKGFHQIAKTSSIFLDGLDPLSYFAREENLNSAQKVNNNPNTSDFIMNSNFHNEHNSPLFNMTQTNTNNSLSSSASSNIQDDIGLLSGEKQLLNIKDIYVQINPGRLVVGTLITTNYRISFFPASTQSFFASNPSLLTWLNIPLGSIDKLEKDNKISEHKLYGASLVISCKDIRQHKFIAKSKVNETNLEKAFNVISHYTFIKETRFLFAFSHSLLTNHIESAANVFEPYDSVREYTRLGLMDEQQSHQWRVSYANIDYKLCDSYPPLLVMPACFSDDELAVVAGFRSEQRLPALCWRHNYNGATLWRSSQPKAGVRLCYDECSYCINIVHVHIYYNII